MSDALPSSIPAAAARFKTPPRAFADVSASQPASDMYFNASAASVAENTVVAPNCLAVSSSFFICSSDAPDIALTSLIVAVKSVPKPTTLLARLVQPDTNFVITLDARFASVAFHVEKLPSAFFADLPASSTDSPAPSAFLSTSSSFSAVSFADFETFSMLSTASE